MSSARLTARSSAVQADFGDWIPPMMVKELRQGLRTSRFVAPFAILQSLLVMTLLITNSVASAEATSQLFWAIVAGVLVLILPMRGFTALPAESKSSSLGLLALTGLSSFRLTVGIWFALVSQIALTAVTILPYVLMRYFAGGVRVSEELTCLLVLVMLSALVTAMAVAASAVPSLILRCLLGLIIAALAVGALAEILDWLDDEGTLLSLFRHSADSFLETAKLTALLFGFWAFLCYFILDMGASAVATCQYHGAPRKRLFAFIAVSCLFLMDLLDLNREDAVSMAVLIVLGLTCIDCLTESPVPGDYGVLTPFLRYGRFGRWAAHFLAPGWATGIVFYLTLVLMVVSATFGARAFYYDFSDLWLPLANSLLIPPTILALALGIFRKTDRVLLPCLICGFSLALLAAGAGFLADLDFPGPVMENVSLLVGLTPATALAFAENLSINAPPYYQTILLVSGQCSGVIALVYVLLKSVPHHRRLRETFSLAAADAQAHRPEASLPPGPGPVDI